MSESVIDLEQYKYDEAEKELRLKLVDYSERPEIQAQIGEAFYIWNNDPAMSSEDIPEDQIDEITFEKFFDWFLYDFRLLDTQERLIEKYYTVHSENLDKLERGLLKDWLKNHYSYFEVEHVSAGSECKIKDIFTKKIFLVRDQTSTKQIKASDIIGARPLKSGKVTYFSGVISVYPAAFKNIILDYFKSELKEYKKQAGSDKTKNDYLKDWGYQIGHFLEEVAKNPKYVTPEGHDFILARASYRLEDAKKAVEKLKRIKSLLEISALTDDIKVFSWEKKGKNDITATLEIDEDNLKIECYSENMLSKAKARIEKELGNLAVHLEDSKKGLLSSAHEDKSTAPAPKKYPLGIKNRKEMDSVLEEHYVKWITEPLGVLNGQTPEQAKNTKKGLEKLSSVLNELESLYEQAKKRGEPYYDVNKLRKLLDIS